MKSLFKRSFSLILILCFMLIGLGLFGATKVNASTTTASFEPSHFSGQGTSGTGSAISATIDGITVSNNKGVGTSEIRMYSGSTIEITSSAGNITQIDFTFSSGKTGGLSTSYTELYTKTWSQALSSQARFTSIVVTYEEDAAKKLTGITIKTNPTTVYEEGTCFDPNGLVITKHFNDSSTEDLEYNALNESKFTFDPSTSTLLKTSDTNVTITVAEQNVNLGITVNAKSIGTLIGGLTNAASLRLNYEDNKYFEKVTDNLLDYSGTYLIVYESGGVAFNGNLETLDAAENKISVNVIDNKIIYTSDLSDCTFTIAKIGETSNYSIMSHSGKYIGSDTYNNELKTSTSDAYSHTIAIDSGNAVITASSKTVLKYNSASNQLRFRYYKSGQQSIQLYKLHDGTREVNSVDIRFKVNMTIDLKTRILTEGSPVEYGYLFAPSERDAAFMINDNVDASNLFKIECDQFNDDGSYALVITGVPSSAWCTTLTVRAYVCIDGTYYYSQTRQLSVKEACQEYLNLASPTEEVIKALGILEYIKNYGA